MGRPRKDATARRTAPVLVRPRQRDVLAWAAHGKTNAAIGVQLGIKEDTVRQHLRAAGKALGAVNRTHAVALALVHKLIEL